jgi:hypothetical protein
MARMTASFPPPHTPLGDLGKALRQDGIAVLSPRSVTELCAVALPELEDLRPSWNQLPADEHLRDGGRYRRRRHASYRVTGGTPQPVAHRAHWQPLEYNALHGGFERWFAPVEADVAQNNAWQRLLIGFGDVASGLKGAQTWYVEAHQFRIDTTDGIGRPTPEGAHRDGVDLVVVLLIDRYAVKGGETRVFDANGPQGQRFTLLEPWTALMLDDARMIHESTPIQPVGPGGHRDTLVLTYRAAGFQGPGAI